MAYPPPSVTNDLLCNADSTDMSGIVMESPMKDITTAKEFPCSISEIGEVRSSWVGQRGITDIIQLRADEQAECKLQMKATEICALAMDCLQAFKSAGLARTENPQVQKAIDHCLTYVPRANTAPKAHSRHVSCNIADLWRQDTQDDIAETEPQLLAQSQLGQQLVGKIVESSHQPPDVSFSTICVGNFPTLTFMMFSQLCRKSSSTSFVTCRYTLKIFLKT